MPLNADNFRWWDVMLEVPGQMERTWEHDRFAGELFVGPKSELEHETHELKVIDENLLDSKTSGLGNAESNKKAVWIFWTEHGLIFVSQLVRFFVLFSLGLF